METKIWFPHISMIYISFDLKIHISSLRRFRFPFLDLRPWSFVIFFNIQHIHPRFINSGGIQSYLIYFSRQVIVTAIKALPPPSQAKEDLVLVASPSNLHNKISLHQESTNKHSKIFRSSCLGNSSIKVNHHIDFHYCMWYLDRKCFMTFGCYKTILEYMELLNCWTLFIIWYNNRICSSWHKGSTGLKRGCNTSHQERVLCEMRTPKGIKLLLLNRL